MYAVANFFCTSVFVARLNNVLSYEKLDKLSEWWLASSDGSDVDLDVFDRLN